MMCRFSILVSEMCIVISLILRIKRSRIVLCGPYPTKWHKFFSRNKSNTFCPHVPSPFSKSVFFFISLILRIKRSRIVLFGPYPTKWHKFFSRNKSNTFCPHVPSPFSKSVFFLWNSEAQHKVRYGSMIKNRGAKRESLKFDSSWDSEIFLGPTLKTRRKNILL